MGDCTSIYREVKVAGENLKVRGEVYRRVASNGQVFYQRKRDHRLVPVDGELDTKKFLEAMERVQKSGVLSNRRSKKLKIRLEKYQYNNLSATNITNMWHLGKDSKEAARLIDDAFFDAYGARGG
jgi:hypothetical protein